MQIALDGPAGVGKSTVAKALAKRLGWLYVNTGAMYRAMAWADNQGIDLNEVQIRVSASRVYVNDQDVTEALYTDEVDRRTSELATQARVRDRLIELQRTIARGQNVVMEGRDIGTVVLPQADLKIYLTASLEERARRRAKQRGEDEQESILEMLDERDARDREGFGRHPAADAVLLSTDDVGVDAVVERVLACLKKQEGAGNL